MVGKRLEDVRIVINGAGAAAVSITKLLLSAGALVVGGVASSALLRRLVGDRLSRLRSPVRVLYGQAQYSADNAAGVASIGMQRYLKEHS